MNLRSFNVAEPCSEDLNVPLALPCGLPDLAPDVFTFSITIGPDVEYVSLPGLVFDVLGNILHVLA